MWSVRRSRKSLILREHLALVRLLNVVSSTLCVMHDVEGTSRAAKGGKKPEWAFGRMMYSEELRSKLREQRMVLALGLTFSWFAWSSICLWVAPWADMKSVVATAGAMHVSLFVFYWSLLRV